MTSYVNLVLFAVIDRRLSVLLIGGDLESHLPAALPERIEQEPDDNLDETIRNIWQTATGSVKFNGRTEQLRMYSLIDGRMTTAYMGITPSDVALGDLGARWWPVEILENSEFLTDGHQTVSSDGLRQIRIRIGHEAQLAAAFLPPQFTISELRTIYEPIWCKKLYRTNFQREIAPAVQPITGRRKGNKYGPSAQLYQLGEQTHFVRPITASTQAVVHVRKPEVRDYPRADRDLETFRPETLAVRLCLSGVRLATDGNP